MTLAVFLSRLNVADRKAIQWYVDAAFAKGAASGKTYTDELGAVWNRPTAQAYAQACKARTKWWSTAMDLQAEIIQLRERLTPAQPDAGIVDYDECIASGQSCSYGEPSPVSEQSDPARAGEDLPWRVGLFWSSSSPGTQVRVLADGHVDIERMAKHPSFIKWVSVQPASGDNAQPDWWLVEHVAADPYVTKIRPSIPSDPLAAVEVTVSPLFAARPSPIAKPSDEQLREFLDAAGFIELSSDYDLVALARDLLEHFLPSGAK